MKIGLCGTMSVGKTTLVNALKETKQFKDYMFRTERSKFFNGTGYSIKYRFYIKGSNCIFS